MTVNGRQINIDKEISLSEFLLKENYDREKIAVEKNGNIVSKRFFDTEMLASSDKIEIVSFVGGG